MLRLRVGLNELEVFSSEGRHVFSRILPRHAIRHPLDDLLDGASTAATRSTNWRNSSMIGLFLILLILVTFTTGFTLGLTLLIYGILTATRKLFSAS